MELARWAQAIYEEQLKRRLESSNANDFVAVEPDSGGGLSPRVSEQLSDHRQAFADQKSTRREGMAEIVNAHIIQSCGLTNTSPWMLKVCKMGLFLFPR